MAILGNAAGTTARALGHFFPRTNVDGVEIDPELTQARPPLVRPAQPAPALHPRGRAAVPAAHGSPLRRDRVDAYRQPYIPFYLATREFFELARDRLNPGGVVLVNIGHPEGEDELEKVLSATMAAVFATVRRDPSEDTNTQLLGTTGPASGRALGAAVPSLPAALRPLARATAARLAPALGGGRVYTDDRAPVEWLIDRSIVDYAAGE